MIKPKGLINNALWNILTVTLTAVAGFLIVPVIIKNIGTESFGIYSIILMIGGFAALQSLGLGEATLKYVAQYYAKKDFEGVNRVLGATLTVYSFSGIIVSGLIIGFSSIIVSWFKISPGDLSIAIEALRIAGLAFLLSIFGGALRTIPEATQRYDILSKYQLVMMVLRYTAMYLIASLGGGIIGLTYLILVSALIDILVFSYLAMLLIPGIRCYPNFQKRGIKEVFNYGIFSFTNDIIQKIALYVDQLILGIFFSISSVAYLTAPKELITKAQGLTGAAGQALFPRFSSMDEGAEMQKLYITSFWLLEIFSIIIFIPLAIVFPAFLSKWLTPEFAENSSDFARLYSLGVAFNGGTVAYFALLKGTGRIKWLTRIISTVTVLTGLATAYLVFKFGIIGSGIRVLLFSFVGTALCLYVGKKVFTGFNTYKVMLETAIVPIILSIVFYFLADHITASLVIDTWFEIILTYAVLVLIMLFFQFGLNRLLYNEKGQSAQFTVHLKGLLISKIWVNKEKLL